MNKSEKYEIDFFGQKFVLSTTDGEKSELKKVVDYYKKVVEDLAKKLPDRQHLDIAILAGLKITDKLYSIASSKDINIEKDVKKLDKVLSDVIKRLDISLGLW